MANCKGQEMVLDYCKSGNEALREPILVEYKTLVEAIARKFSYNKSDFDDLIQVGSLALLSSLDRFDPSKEVNFSTFATPNIIGEIKHYFRDKNKLVKVPRKLQELGSKIRTYMRNTQHQDRSPTVSEMSEALGVSEEEILESLEAQHSSQTLSLDSTYYTQDSDSSKMPTLLDQICVDGRENYIIDKEMLDQALSILPEIEYQAVVFRFYDGLSQVEIAKKLNLSQMHISRLLRKALSKLNDHITKGESH